MKRSLTFLTLAALLTVVSLAPAAPLGSAPPAIAWRADVFPAFRQAIDSHKPLVICFVGEDKDGLLPQCRKLVREVFAGPELTAYSERAIFVIVNTALDDANGNFKKLMHDLDIKDVPTVSVLQCTPDKIYETGTIVGHYETAEYVKLFGKLHAECAAKIADANRPSLTPAQEAAKARELLRELDDKSGLVMKAGAEYRRVLNNLMVSGPFDLKEIHESYVRMKQANEDMGATIREVGRLSSPEAVTYSSELLDGVDWELRLCKEMQTKLLDLIERTGLRDAASRELVQTLVLDTDHSISDEFTKRMPAICEVSEKLVSHYKLVQ